MEEDSSNLVRAVHRKSGINQLMKYKGTVVIISVLSQMQHRAATGDPVPLSPGLACSSCISMPFTEFTVDNQV